MVPVAGSCRSCALEAEFKYPVVAANLTRGLSVRVKAAILLQFAGPIVAKFVVVVFFSVSNYLGRFPSRAGCSFQGKLFSISQSFCCAVHYLFYSFHCIVNFFSHEMLRLFFVISYGCS